MVGLVLVSHSRVLAEALQQMLDTLYGGRARVAVAAGSGDDHGELGTDAIAIMEAIQQLDSPAGVAVLLDLGSAVLSAETALDLLDEEMRGRVVLCAAPLVEGAIAAAALSSTGADLAAVRREAENALQQKTQHLAPAPAPNEPAPVAAGPGESIVLRIENAHGLHARPAMRIVETAARFSSVIEIVNLRTNRPAASARSLVAINCLEAREGDEIRITARGPDAAAALRALEILQAEHFGDSPNEPVVAPPKAAATEGPLRGRPLSDGVALGPVFFSSRQVALLPEPAAITDVAAETNRLENALAAVRQALVASANSSGEIFRAHLILLDDPELAGAAHDLISREKLSAIQAWTRAAERVAASYRHLHDPLLVERAADVEDLRQQVLQRLGVPAPALSLPDEPSILAVATLLPSEVAALDFKRVRGIIAEAIGATSHATILLRAAGVAAIDGLPMARLRMLVQPGDAIAFDGGTGEIWPSPDEATRSMIKARQEATSAADAKASGPTETRDGKRIEIAANVANLAEAEAAARAGAEAIGLLRTEFLFFDRAKAPTEDEQVEALRKIAACFPATAPITVRTLDIGGDKPVPYLPVAHEANPFLGVRGLRLALRQRDLFLGQLRAILRAALGHRFRVMFPMVTEVEELRLARLALQEAHEQLLRTNVPHVWPIEVGMMVEVPAAALNARSFVNEIDFFSIGTNDLTQYTLAAERGHPRLPGLDDALHPAVLRLISLVAATALRHGKKTGVCGEAAADPVAAGIFLGLDVCKLSVNAGSVPRLRRTVAALDLHLARAVARRCLNLDSATAVREHFTEAIS